MSDRSDLELFRERLGVSRETVDRLQIYADMLKKWQKIKNLVAPSTLGHLWERHFEDSLQLVRLSNGAVNWVDLGAGAGFPGLVIALTFKPGSSENVRLIESDHRKCAFMREVIRETRAAANVINDRIENVVDDLEDADIVTARALTALPTLLEYAAPLLQKGATGLFLKGQDVVSELTTDPIFSRVDLKYLPSSTDSRARIVQARWRVNDPEPIAGL